jgi:hypothetical protein
MPQASTQVKSDEKPCCFCANQRQLSNSYRVILAKQGKVLNIARIGLIQDLLSYSICTAPHDQNTPISNNSELFRIVSLQRDIDETAIVVAIGLNFAGTMSAKGAGNTTPAKQAFDKRV